ncbi:MAG: hypothetical protein H5T45_05450 [Thermoplasmatales archaeon]|nr:hypothetical protein [Thermoplasmatales archaeon]
MTNITLSIPDELKKKMEKYSEIKWSQIARKAIEEKIRELELLDKLTKDSKLTEKDVEEIDRFIKGEIARKDFQGYGRKNLKNE